MLLILTLSFTTLLRKPPELGEQALALLGRPTRLAEETEQYFRESLVLRRTLGSLQVVLRTAVGQREFGNLYLADNGLIPRFAPTEDVSIHKRNTRALGDFVQRVGIPTAAVIIPTPVAIYQDKLPPFTAEMQFNQRGYIEQVNKSLSGSVAAVDVYASLFAARKDYLYYRTDDMLTTHGGYIVYQNIARRLGLSPVTLQSMRTQFLPEPYYGELYQQWGYGGVKSDSVALYHSNKPTLFTVSHWRRFEEKTYYSLYPTEANLGGEPLNTILGGHSPKITITNHSLDDSRGSLLVLGDRNMLSVLPFLAQHYSRVTFADPDLLTGSELAELVPSDYTQVLFGFSLERYMNSAQPARAATAGTVQAQK